MPFWCARRPMRAFLVVLAVLSLTCLQIASHGDRPPGGAPARAEGPAGRAAAPFAGPQYTRQGELILPEGYKNWIFVGANLGVEYGERGAPKKANDSAGPARTGNFHHVYIDPAAFAHYARTGEFPEKTVLMLDVYEAQAGQPGDIVAQGLYPGKALGVAAAVKNSNRPDGQKTNWAYYDFGLSHKTAKAFANSACYDCHLEHASDDNVWVQFYPTLLELKKK